MKNHISKVSRFFMLILLMGCIHGVRAQITSVEIDIPATPVQIDPMIYGQMLENVNDSMIYGGVTDLSGNVRRHLIPHLRALEIPVMRWPGGTVVYEYHWEKGTGPRGQRPTVPNLAWGGIENYQFGTDEFLQWCQDIGTQPYINFNMSIHPEFESTIADALGWIEYVNGGENTYYGSMRAKNGHAAPYNVNYWGIGNENYLDSRAGRIKESDVQYAQRLKQWAGAIRDLYPDLQLLGIGRSLKWNQTVLEENGNLIDFLTQHYYITSKVQDGRFVDPLHTLFAPAKMEAHLALLGAQLEKANERLGRQHRPIRLSIDEWNNRHSTNDGDKFRFTRHDPRRQFDVAVTASTLNVFIRQSPHVGMANYIFPVNAHGLIRTVGDDDAYHTPTYEVFRQYRQRMVGSKLDVQVAGPGVATADIRPSIAGDAEEAAFAVESLSYVDAAAVLDIGGHIQLSLVNRSHNAPQRVAISVPKGYTAMDVWELAHPDINATHTADNRDEIKPQIRELKVRKGKITVDIPPCGLQLITLVAK